MSKSLRRSSSATWLADLVPLDSETSQARGHSSVTTTPLSRSVSDPTPTRPTRASKLGTPTMPPMASSPAAAPRPSSSPLPNSQFEVEQILGERTVKNQLQYLVKWVGYTSDDNSWEPAANLESARHAIAVFKSAASPATKKQATNDKSSKTRGKADITLQAEPNTSPLQSINSGEAVDVSARQDTSTTHIPLLLQPMDEDVDDSYTVATSEKEAYQAFKTLLAKFNHNIDGGEEPHQQAWSTMYSHMKTLANSTLLNASQQQQLLALALQTLQAADGTHVHADDHDSSCRVLAALDALSASLCCITAAAAARTVIADATDEFFALIIRTVAYQTKHNVLNAHAVVVSDDKAAEEEPAESSQDENSSDDEDSDDETMKKHRKKTRRVSAPRVDKRLTKELEKQSILVRTKLRTALQRLQLCIRLKLLHDQQLNILIRMAFDVLSVDAPTAMQLSCLNLLCAVFMHHSKFRQQIIEDSVECYGKFRDCIQSRPNRQRHLRTFPVDTKATSSTVDQSNSSIQMPVALCLHLLQCLPALWNDDGTTEELLRLPDVSEEVVIEHVEPAPPKKKGKTNKQTASNVEPVMASTRLPSFANSVQQVYQQCQQHLRMLIHLMVNTCMRHIGTSSDAEAKIGLFDFADDLQTVSHLPEWPVADELLSTFTAALRRFAMPDTTKDSDKEEKKLQEQRRLLSIELIGHITAALQKTVLSTQRKTLTLLPRKKLEEGQDELEGGEDISCICGNTDGKVDMLDCDDCHKWFHLSCMHISAEDIESARDRPAQWIWHCDGCELRIFAEKRHQRQLALADTVSKTSKRRAKAHTEPDQIESMSQSAVLHQCLIDHLSQNQSSSLFARQYWLCMWVNDAMIAARASSLHSTVSASESSAEVRTAASESKTLWIVPTNQISASAFSRSALLQMSRQTVLARPTSAAFCSHLSSLGTNLYTILSNIIKETRPAVRSRALKALALVIEQKPDMMHEQSIQRAVLECLHDTSITLRETALDLVGRFSNHANADMLLVCLHDKGVSVRKKAIQLLSDLCIANPQEHTATLAALLSCVRDEEDSIRKTTVKTFAAAWFSGENPAVRERRAASKASQLHVTFSDAFKLLVMSLSDCVRALHAQRHDAIEIMTELLALIFKDTKTVTVAKDVCTCMVQLLLICEHESRNDMMCACMQTLQVFALVRPTLLAPLLSSLQIYVRPVATVDAALSAMASTQLIAVLSVFRCALTASPELAPSLVDTLVHDLRATILTAVPRVLREAVPCLCVLITHIVMSPKALDEIVLLLCEKVLACLQSDEQDNRDVPRCLLTLGLLSKFHRFDHFEVAEIDDLRVKLNVPNVINREPAHFTDILSALFRHFANSHDAGVHKACLQGMCFFLSRRPDLLTAFVPTLRNTLGAPSTGADTQGAQLQLIRALSDFVKSEQQRTEQLQLNARYESDSETEGKVAPGAQLRQAESEQIISALQELLPLFLKLCLCSSADLRFESFTLIQSLNAQGMVLPRAVVPTFIAGLVDPAVSELCLAELKNLHEKFPDFFRSSLLEGVRNMFMLVTKKGGFKAFELSAYDEVRRAADVLYTMIKSKSAVRSEFLNKLIDQLDKSVDVKQFYPKTNRLFPASARMLSYPAFIAYFVSVLPFEHDEPISVLMSINRSVGARAADIETALRELFKSVQSSVIDEACMQQCIGLCNQALVVLIMLQLKAYVRAAFGLSEVRAIGTDESTPKTLRITCTRKANVVLDLLASVPIAATDELLNAPAESTVFPALLVRQYEAFKQALDITDIEIQTQPVKKRGRASLTAADSTVPAETKPSPSRKKSKGTPTQCRGKHAKSKRGAKQAKGKRARKNSDEEEDEEEEEQSVDMSSDDDGR